RKTRRRLLQFVAAGDVDGVQIRPFPDVAEEHDDASIRRESRSFVVETLRQDALARAVRLQYADRKLPIGLAGESDVVAARRPHRRRVMSLAEADALRRPAGCGH